MSEPFPMKADMDFFVSEEAAPLQELWEPMFGDCICDPNDGNRIAILAHQVEVNKWQAYWPYAKRLLWADVEKLIFLPRPQQLWEILEEMGWHMSLSGRQAGKDYEYYVVIYNVNNYRIDGHGPTPAIALGRALLEAIQGGKK